MSHQLVSLLGKEAIPFQSAYRVGYQSLRVLRITGPSEFQGCLCCYDSTQRIVYGQRTKLWKPSIEGSSSGAQRILMERYRVRRLMREQGLKPVWKRKFVHTPDSRHNLPVLETVLARQFNPDQPDQARVSDLTSIRT